MTPASEIDQDALAADWGLALEAEGVADGPPGQRSSEGGGPSDEMAAQWAAMIDDGGQFV